MGFLASIGKITMKREGQYYLLIGLLVCALAFLQFNPFKKERLAVVSDVKKITEIDQLIIKMKCNVFFIEGDEQSIVYEAPARLIEKIRIDNNKGFVTIGMEKKGIVARLWEYFHPVPTTGLTSMLSSGISKPSRSAIYLKKRLPAIPARILKICSSTTRKTGY